MQMGEILLLQCSINVRDNDLWDWLMTADNDTKWGSLMLWIKVRFFSKGKIKVLQDTSGAVVV